MTALGQPAKAKKRRHIHKPLGLRFYYASFFRPSDELNHWTVWYATERDRKTAEDNTKRRGPSAIPILRIERLER
jgi:hypothetical protein